MRLLLLTSGLVVALYLCGASRSFPIAFIGTERTPLAFDGLVLVYCTGLAFGRRLRVQWPS